ncbi:HPr kinase/phosphorylase [Segnochrobactrum spirostomi]|uniref:Serine/threonine protein kinase n=1 Tax=Segnochrobactrum spirostomi TaxID=2608987 RepID=A0A6A7Y4M1_9HYPH|nr:serine/threonine protein kinase [Segnochrobactrum spirostomi]MQT12669.1 serine/threonine protein kinase [Segnochrobactrum spirostomi]
MAVEVDATGVAARPHTARTIHATVLLAGEAGILIRGASGAGKSALALALLDLLAARGRFARLVADDQVFLAAVNGRLLARVPAPIAGLVERRGAGIEPIAHEPAAIVRLVVDLVEPAALERVPEWQERLVRLAGIDLPRLTLPCRSAETAAGAVLATVERLGNPCGTGA